MSESNAYRVVVTGEIPNELSKAEVVAAFARVFKVDEKQAGLYFQGKPRLLRRNLDSVKAESYTKVLTQIGVPFEVMPEQQQTAEEPGHLSSNNKGSVRLDVAANEEQRPVQAAPAAEEPLSSLSLVGESGDASLPATGERKKSDQHSMICPKCRSFQPRAEECGSCGIVVAKYDPLVHATDHSNDQQLVNAEQQAVEAESDEAALASTGIFASFAKKLASVFKRK